MAHEKPDRDEIDAMPLELRELHRQLQDDSVAWQRHTPAPTRLIAHYETLLAQRHAADAHASQQNDISLRHTRHHERGFMHTTQKRLGGIFAAIMVAALIAATVVIFQHHPGKRNVAQPPTATPVAALHVAASQGWVRPDEIAFGKSIAFAPNAPLTGYVCGNTLPLYGAAAPAPLRFSVTHDGGRTWQELAPTPAQGWNCQLAIAPTDANDIVMQNFTTAGNPTTYRSRDGGQSWSPLLLPAGDSAQAGIVLPIWAGTTLFVDAFIGLDNTPDHPTRVPHTIAVSVNGGALAWADDTALFHIDPSSTIKIGWSFALGTTYYAQLSVSTCTTISPTSSHCAYTPLNVKTSDNGMTWSRFTLSANAPHSVFGTMADGQTLLGENDAVVNDVGETTPAISRDAGQTWQALPMLPAAHAISSLLLFNQKIASASDGTLFGEEQVIEYDSQGNILHTTGPYKLIKLVPGASAWSDITTLPGITGFAVSVDGAGHPNAVWSTISDGNQQQPGIAYHAP